MPLLNRLVPIKWTCLLTFSFNLAFKRGGHSVTIGVINRSIISKQLICALRMDGLSWSLGLGINGNMRQVQIWERSFDLTEAVVKATYIGATELCQEGVEVKILPYRFFLGLTELILDSFDLFLFILKVLPQQLHLLLQLTSDLLLQGKLLFLDRLPSLQLP